MNLSKFQQGQIAKQGGLNVPYIFPTLDDAIKSKKSFLNRSESPWEHFSGTFDSVATVFDKSEKEKYLEFFENIIYPSNLVVPDNDLSLLLQNRDGQLRELNQHNIKMLSSYLEISEEKISSQLNFSLWHLFGGRNSTIIADSSVPNRYHIMSKCQNYASGYTIFENGEVIYNRGDNILESHKDSHSADIEMYKQVTSIFNTDKNPLIEFQRFNDENYFLQITETQETQESEPFLSGYKLKDKEFEIPWVRGATQEIELDIVTDRGVLTEISESSGLTKRTIEERLPFQKNRVLLLSTGRYSRIPGIYETTSTLCPIHMLNTNIISKDLGHFTQNALFKPNISIGIDLDSITKKELYSHIEQGGKITLRSDGRRGIIKLI